ncbi:MAG: BMP family ABC transporter substrate-binding protein [Bacilli bacterium]|nr:BMP family ABC transporter substrate-binding protein [Bacilli bacterium]
MRKQLKFIAPLALAAVMATSCGGGNKPYTPGNKLKVGLICLNGENSTYDKNFIDAFNAATKECKNIIETTNIKTGIPESEKATEAAGQFARDGYNIVFSDSYGHDKHIKQAAIDNPYVLFSAATGDMAYSSGISNYHNAFASIYQGRFVAGYIGGLYLVNKHKVTKGTDTYIGYVGAYPYAEVISGYTAWYLGVRYALQKKGEWQDQDLAKLHMRVTYTSSWHDHDLEKQSAQRLITKKGDEEGTECVLISQHADSMGVPEACEQAAKPVPNITYNMSTEDQCPKTYLGHSRINWTPYYKQVIENTFDGLPIQHEGENRNWTGKMLVDATGKVAKESSVMVESSTDPDKFSSTDITDIEGVIKGVSEGSIEVFDTDNFKVSRENNEGKDYTATSDVSGTLEEYYVDINADGNIDKTKDKNIVDKENDKVLESYYRSAPSFDLIIDGIEIE